jgi:putative ABC transport system ATP-binding protein
LSGGEQQRVAIARAFVNRPAILFADEPTGNLDSQNGEIVLNMMQEMYRDFGTTVVVVTHDPGIAALGTQKIQLKDGQLL